MNAVDGPSSPARSLRSWLGLCFGFNQRVDRREYALVGWSLMVVKYLVDAGLLRVFAGKLWTPKDYLLTFSSVYDRFGNAPSWLPWFLVLWTLPFIWVGSSMSIRRAADAGFSPWFGMFFFAPFANYLLMFFLASVPTRSPESWNAEKPKPVMDDRFQSALLGIAAGIVISLGMVILSTKFIPTYGITLFMGAPAVMGAVSSFIFNYRHHRTIGDTLQVIVIGGVMSMGSLLLFALEGAGCIIMATPIALLISLFGGVLGRAIAVHTRPSGLPPILLILALPVAGALEPDPAPLLYEVVSVMEIDAAPSEVWPNVIGFSDLPAPKSWLFSTGVAYPVRARIEGTGVGAVRHCEFSTGDFVEPITAWEEPSRLSFDVASQPPTMKEWSFWDIHPPHLDWIMLSRQGEFRLIEQSDGVTRLEGSTWYELDIHPRPYWRLYSDAIVHRIHERVLHHVKRLSEEM